MKLSLIFILVLMLSKNSFTQYSILDNPTIQEKVEKCLYAMYSTNFKEARSIQGSLEQEMPQHPAPYFLKALIVYWENYPMLLDNPAVPDFISNMDKSIDLSNILLDNDTESIEGIFFDMHSRAFKAMFWADNGKPGKVLFDLDNMYRQTLMGIELKDKFNEFYFSSGIYNYYIEAYIEIHPQYKPFAVLFKKGDKALGIKELDYAAKHTSYIKYESILFQSLLQLNYENNVKAAIDPIATLYNNFPKNIYFTSQYIIVLLYNSNFTLASVLADRIDPSKGDFYAMTVYLTKGFLLENQSKKLGEAKKEYLSAINSADKLGNMGDFYSAISYAGLSRIAEKEGDSKLARSYRNKSSHLAGYKFILDY